MPINTKTAKFRQLKPMRRLEGTGITQDEIIVSRESRDGEAKPKIHVFIGANIMQKGRLIPGDSVKVSLSPDPRLCKLERTNVSGEGWKVRQTAGAKAPDGTPRGTFVLTPTEEDMGIFFPNGTNRFNAAEVDANPREIVFSL